MLKSNSGTIIINYYTLGYNYSDNNQSFTNFHHLYDVFLQLDSFISYVDKLFEARRHPPCFMIVWL